jgi:hypothetical protein
MERRYKYSQSWLRELTVEENVGFAGEDTLLVHTLHEGVTDVEPHSFPLVLVASVGDIVPASHASRMTHYAVELVLVARCPWSVVRGLLILEDGIYF